MTTNTDLAVVNWLANGDTCDSSKTLAFWAAFNIKAQDASHPRDPGDVRRCIKLLRAAPALRGQMEKMADLSGLWAQMVMHWDEIEQTLIEESGDDLTDPRVITQKSSDLINDVLSGVHRKKACAK